MTRKLPVVDWLSTDILVVEDEDSERLDKQAANRIVVERPWMFYERGQVLDPPDGPYDIQLRDGTRRLAFVLVVGRWFRVFQRFERKGIITTETTKESVADYRVVQIRLSSHSPLYNDNYRGF
jgi:hypothetical protein